jgi:hypothetical protein
VVDINNYDVLLGLDFLIKIGAMVDVEHGLIQIKQGLDYNVHELPLNMVNMLQIVIKNVTHSDNHILRIIYVFSHLHIRASEKQNNLHHDLEDLKGWCNHIQNDRQFDDDYGSTLNMDHWYNSYF